MMFCPDCGKEQTDNTNFCVKCGKSLKTSTNQVQSGSNQQIGSAERERVFQGIPPARMKELVMKAAWLCNKYGLTAYSVAWGGILKFHGNTLGIAIGRKMASMGGTGGKVIVTESTDGSSVGIAWEKDNEKSQRMTSIFWEKLEAVSQPGGYKPKRRSAALVWATILLFALAAYQGLALIVTLKTLFQPEQEPSYGTIMWFVLITGAAIFAAMRKHWGSVFTISIFLPVVNIIGFIIVFPTGTLDKSNPIEVILAFLAQIICAILLSRTKADFI